MNTNTHATELVQAYADWMKVREWHHFVTLTFNAEVSPRSAEQYIGNTFVRHLERVSQQRVDYYGSVERGPMNDRPHAHLLLGGTQGLTSDAIRGSWRRGWASVGRYDPTQNAVWYSGKSLGSENAVLLLRDLRTGQ